MTASLSSFDPYSDRPPVVGIIGTGFIARLFISELCRRIGSGQTDLKLGPVLTRRRTDEATDFPVQEKLTNALPQLLDQADLVIECSGDPLWATETIEAALKVGLPVLTFASECHLVAGSYLQGLGYLGEAEGDQPGSMAALAEEAALMGFRPLVYGNMKGFLNHTPKQQEMHYWAEKQGLSLAMVTAFTDGTKLQIEQALIGNGLGADIAQEGLLGPKDLSLAEAGESLTEAAKNHGAAITDYALAAGLPHGVFIMAEHDENQASALAYTKMGPGPAYLLQKAHVLLHLEIFKSIQRLRQGLPPLLNNSAAPTLSVAALAKHDLAAGVVIENGIGSFELRGEAVRIADRPGHLPIGLARNIRLKRKVLAGEMLMLSDLEVNPSRALQIWQETETEQLQTACAS